MRAIKNKYPCCNKRTGFKLDTHPIGDIIRRACPMCQQKYKIEFKESTIMDGFVVLEWTKI